MINNLLRRLGVLSLLVGAIGSTIFTIYTGRNNSSMLLVLLFAAWVFSPYLALWLANGFAKSASVRFQNVVYALMIIIAAASMLFYSGTLSFADSKPAFIFLVLPFASWLLIAIILFMARKAK